MERRKKHQEPITLTEWLIELIDTPKWRAGEVRGMKHPVITQKEIDRIGRRELLEQAKELERAGLIEVKWRNLGSDIEKLHVPVDAMGALCRLAGRINPREELETVRNDVAQWRSAIPADWRRDYYDYLLDRLASGEIPADARDPVLFRFLNALPEDGATVWKRIFSSSVVNRSKVFENNYESKMLTIIRKYAPEVEEEMEDQELLAEFGILSYSQTLEIKGPLRYRINGGGEIDTAPQIFGAVLNAQTLTASEPVALDGVKRIVIIENKANYEDAAFDPEILYIYCHGFFSQKERRFLKQLYLLAGREVKICHWGDMDYGGIRIYQFIKRRLFPNLQPLYMGKPEFAKALAAGAGIPLNAKKRTKLEMLDAGDLEELKQCILDYAQEIEQETLLAVEYRRQRGE